MLFKIAITVHTHRVNLFNNNHSIWTFRNLFSILHVRISQFILKCNSVSKLLLRSNLYYSRTLILYEYLYKNARTWFKMNRLRNKLWLWYETVAMTYTFFYALRWFHEPLMCLELTGDNSTSSSLCSICWVGCCCCFVLFPWARGTLSLSLGEFMPVITYKRTVKLDYYKIFTHAHYSFILNTFTELRYADNSCPAYWQQHNHFPTSPAMYCATVVCSAGRDCMYRLLVRNTTWVKVNTIWQA
jgi:hypothetical protein